MIESLCEKPNPECDGLARATLPFKLDRATAGMKRPWAFIDGDWLRILPKAWVNQGDQRMLSPAGTGSSLPALGSRQVPVSALGPPLADRSSARQV